MTSGAPTPDRATARGRDDGEASEPLVTARPSSPVVDRADITGLVGGAVRGGGSPSAAPPVLGCHIEYAVMCAEGKQLHWPGSTPVYREYAADRCAAADIDSQRFLHPCDPHRVVARLVSDWSDPGSVAVWGQQK